MFLTAILLFVVLNCNATKIYRVNVIADWSYKGNKFDIELALFQANLIFDKFGIKFVMTEFSVSSIQSANKTLESTLDNFCNCAPEKYDVTIGVVGEHNGGKVGMAFLGEFLTRYSCLAIDLTTLKNEGRTGPVLAHELMHLMGLNHHQDADNIMHHYTSKIKMTSRQENIIYRFGDK